MISVGRYHTLTISHATNQGLYLTDGEEQVLLPKRYCEREMLEGQEIRVFVYTDSEDRPIATTDTPYGQVDEFAFLEVVSVTDHGVFFDWGLSKDLFMPHAQKLGNVEVGRKYIVRILYDDRSHRPIATVRLRPFFKKDLSELSVGERLIGMVYDFREEGVMVILNDLYSAMIHKAEFKQRPLAGATFPCYIKEISEDGKIRASLVPATDEARLDAMEEILELLEEAGGELPFNDASSPEDIQRVFGLSKKSFKKFIGNLLRQKKIILTTTGMKLVDQPNA